MNNVVLPEQKVPSRTHPARAEGYLVVLKPVGYFRQSEQVCVRAVADLAERMVRAGVWTAPLPVEAASGWIMDGNHRFNAARSLRLRYLLCVPLCYGDARMRALPWADGAPYGLDELRRLAQACELLPYKSTRHLFWAALPSLQIALDLLR